MSGCLSMCMYGLMLWNWQPKPAAVSAEGMLIEINITYVSLWNSMKAKFLTSHSCSFAHVGMNGLCLLSLSFSFSYQLTNKLTAIHDLSISLRQRRKSLL